MSKKETENKNETPKNSKKIRGLKGLKHPGTYLDLIKWIAMPEPFRSPKTQGEFAKEHKIGEDSISEMKKREGFWEEVKEKRKEWGKERTPDVILGLYKKAVKDGNAQEVKLWLQYFEGWSEKQEIKHSGEITEKVEVSVEELENYIQIRKIWRKNKKKKN